jgi:hypothetical protein
MAGEIYVGKYDIARRITTPVRINGNLVANSHFHNIGERTDIMKLLVGEVWSIATLVSESNYTITYHNPGITITNNDSTNDVYLYQRLKRTPPDGMPICATGHFTSTGVGTSAMYLEYATTSGMNTYAYLDVSAGGKIPIVGIIPANSGAQYVNLVFMVFKNSSMRIDWVRVDEDTYIEGDEEYVGIDTARIETSYYVQRLGRNTILPGVVEWGYGNFRVSPFIMRMQSPAIVYHENPGTDRPHIRFATGNYEHVNPSQFSAFVDRAGLYLSINNLTNQIQYPAYLHMNFDEIIFNALE